jgi:hypothetical protein
VGIVKDASAAKHTLDGDRRAIKHLDGIQLTVQTATPEDLNVNIVDGLFATLEGSQTIFGTRSILDIFPIVVPVLINKSHICNDRLESTLSASKLS